MRKGFILLNRQDAKLVFSWRLCDLAGYPLTNPSPCGIRGGQTYGKTDEFAEYPVENIMGPENIAHTVYHAMGIDDLTATDATGRLFNIVEKGRPLTELF